MSLCYLDLDFDDWRASFRRAVEFVSSTSIKYGLSSNNLAELGGREIKSIPELVSNDYEWSSKGPVRTAPQPSTRLVFELKPTESPLACENFMALCTHSKGMSKSSGQPLHYLGTKIHRYSSNLGIIQGGDIQFGNGSGGESIWNKKFKDDAKGLKLKHNTRGTLSMGNSGKNSNSSQFFITLKAEGAPQCDKKHVVFGQLIHGFDTLDLLHQMILDSNTATNDDNLKVVGEDSEVPPFLITVTGCGEWNPLVDLPQGYYKPDDTNTFLPPYKRDE